MLIKEAEFNTAKILEIRSLMRLAREKNNKFTCELLDIQKREYANNLLRLNTSLDELTWDAGVMTREYLSKLLESKIKALANLKSRLSFLEMKLDSLKNPFKSALSYDWLVSRLTSIETELSNVEKLLNT